MLNLIYIAVIITSALYIASRTVYHLHMFQLNSYRKERYFRFLKTNRIKILTKSRIGLMIIVGLLSIAVEFLNVTNGVIIPLIWILVTLMACYPLYFKRERTKKPLVYTARVKRIFLMTGILYTITLVIAFLGINKLFIVSIVMFLSPIYMLSANLLLIPFEVYLKSYYKNDAVKKIRAHKELIIVGVTGSYGKTSVKFMLEKILSQQFNVLVTPQSYNTPMGIIITIRKFLNLGHDVFVAEMGAKQTGDIKEICDLVNPRFGVITAVGPQHLETFGSLSKIIDTKFELAKSLPAKGKCFVNNDSNNVKEGMKRFDTVHYVTYGTDDSSQIKIENVQQTSRGSSFTLMTESGRFEFQTKLLGLHNILNIAGAIGLALELGMTYDKIAMGVNELKAVEHRLELKKQGDYFILDDAFNSNPSGAKSALDVLNQFDSGSKIIMTPGMIELGSMDYEIHHNFGKQISEVCDYVILIGESKTAAIKAGLADSGYNMSQVSVCKSVYEGFAKIREIVNKGDIVLIENDLPDNFNE